MIPRSFQPLAAAVAATSMWACSPSLDWREVRPLDSSVVALFPCKPSGQERRVLMAGQPVRLTLLACEEIRKGIAELVSLQQQSLLK